MFYRKRTECLIFESIKSGHELGTSLVAILRHWFQPVWWTNYGEDKRRHSIDICKRRYSIETLINHKIIYCPSGQRAVLWTSIKVLLEVHLQHRWTFCWRPQMSSERLRNLAGMSLTSTDGDQGISIKNSLDVSVSHSPLWRKGDSIFELNKIQGELKFFKIKAGRKRGGKGNF